MVKYIIIEAQVKVVIQTVHKYSVCPFEHKIVFIVPPSHFEIRSDQRWFHMFNKCEQLYCVSLLGGSFKKQYGGCQNPSSCHTDGRDCEDHEMDPRSAWVLKLSPCAVSHPPTHNGHVSWVQRELRLPCTPVLWTSPALLNLKQRSVLQFSLFCFHIQVAEHCEEKSGSHTATHPQSAKSVGSSNPFIWTQKIPSPISTIFPNLNHSFLDSMQSQQRIWPPESRVLRLQTTLFSISPLATFY